ncbi:PCP reductase family protein [Okeanomitos corallinicola TIOX110]|uniref:PCP reductase family protein n=1 Tax=Okeanomitos corallinicola TIOX110 TaxID=3133117 RepID=A0ABZ2UQN0_9CYAN
MSEQIKWTVEAEAKIKEIPFFVRPFARKKIENYAQENGVYLINIEVYDQAKQLFNKNHNN